VAPGEVTAAARAEEVGDRGFRSKKDREAFLRSVFQCGNAKCANHLIPTSVVRLRGVIRCDVCRSDKVERREPTRLKSEIVFNENQERLTIYDGEKIFIGRDPELPPLPPPTSLTADVGQLVDTPTELSRKCLTVELCGTAGNHWLKVEVLSTVNKVHVRYGDRTRILRQSVPEKVTYRDEIVILSNENRPILRVRLSGKSIGLLPPED